MEGWAPKPGSHGALKEGELGCCDVGGTTVLGTAWDSGQMLWRNGAPSLWGGEGRHSGRQHQLGKRGVP